MEKSVSNRFPLKLFAPNAANGAKLDDPEAIADGEDDGATIPRVPFLILAAIAAISAFLGSTYLFTRPCVVGPCPLLQTAADTSQQSSQKLKTTNSKPDILAVQSQLRQTARQLQAIPPWSQQRQPAQTLVQTLQTQADALNPILAAQDQAAIALQQSQNPPHSADEWTQIQQQWQRAIVQLNQVPNSSSAYPLARRKLAEYQKNAMTAQQYLLVEQRAAQLLRQARAAAQLAETRQNIAEDIPGWQKAQTSWQMALNLLRQIPRNSTAAAQVDELTTTYQAKLVTVRNRSTQEQMALTNYTQAQRLAQQATAQQQRQQWTQAIATWRNALDHLKQIPSDTLYSEQAQALTSTYEGNLLQAQQNLDRVSLRQNSESDLAKTCAGTPRICTYRITADVIRVQLTQAYVNNLLEKTTLARQQGNTQAQAGIQQHLNTLQTALESVSNNSGMAMEIYNPNGALMTRYDPSR